MAAHQEVTRDWWRPRGAFDLFYSEAVRAEAAMGDRAAAAARLVVLDDLVLLKTNPSAGTGQRLGGCNSAPSQSSG